jgi:hypothetical protein
MLVDDDNRPRYWSTVWQTVYGHALAPSTLAQVLAAIEQLYVTVREIKGDDILDDLIAHHEYGHLAVVLEAHFVKLANKAVRGGRLGRYSVSPSISGSPAGWFRSGPSSDRCAERA